MQWLKKRRRTVGGAAALLLLFLLVWVFRSYGGDPELDNVNALREQLRGDAAKNLSPEQRRELWQQYNQAVKQLSPLQRNVLWKESQRAFEQKVRHFLSLPKRQQIAQLDKEIDRMEAARKQFEARQKQSGGAAVKVGAPPKGKGPASTPQEREQRRKERLDQTTPEQRALFAEYSRLLNERRKQRGLPTSTLGRK